MDLYIYMDIYIWINGIEWVSCLLHSGMFIIHISPLLGLVASSVRVFLQTARYHNLKYRNLYTVCWKILFKKQGVFTSSRCCRCLKPLKVAMDFRSTSWDESRWWLTTSLSWQPSPSGRKHGTPGTNHKTRSLLKWQLDTEFSKLQANPHPTFSECFKATHHSAFHPLLCFCRSCRLAGSGYVRLLCPMAKNTILPSPQY